MGLHQTRFQREYSLDSIALPLNAQAYVLQRIFNAHVTAHHGRFVFRDAWPETIDPNHPSLARAGGDAQKNAVEATKPFLATMGISTDQVKADAGDYTACAFTYLLHGLYLGALHGKISAENRARQLSWLSQVPSHAETIFKYTYDVKWFTKSKALHGPMLFVGDGVGEALANESVRLMREIAPCEAISAADAASRIDHASAFLLAFVLSEADRAWAISLLGLAKEKGFSTAAITMLSLQADILPHTDACLPFPTVTPIAVPVLGIMPMQVFANDIALSKGLQTHSLLH